MKLRYHFHACLFVVVVVAGKTEIGYFSACPQWDAVSFVIYQFLIKLTLRLILTQNKETNKAI